MRKDNHFWHVVRKCIEKGNKVLILAHRGELIDQAADKLCTLGVDAQIEQASSYARSVWEPDCVVGTVQTLRGKRLESWPRDYFRLIVTDEAHHATATTYQAIYQHFNALHLGVTATADRADEDSLSDVFESVAFEYSLWDAMKAAHPGPYLCRLTFVQCDLQIDLRSVRTTAGDFNMGDLEARITPMVDSIANAIRQEIGDRKTIVFTPDVGSGMAIASALKSLWDHHGNPFKAEAVWGGDPERDNKIERFHKGEIKILCNCALLTEGFDCPDVSAIVFARPTKSRPLYAQMVGRGTRIATDKENCLIVDFDYLTAKHDLVKPVELFDTTHTDAEMLEIAMQMVHADKDLPLDEAIEKASRAKEERAKIRVVARQRSLKYGRVSYDPIAISDTFGIPWRGTGDLSINKCTQKQAELLTKFGVENADTMSKTRAKTMIDFLIQRRNAGLASMKQTSWLIAKGVPPEEARKMSFEDASKKLDQLFSRRTASVLEA